MGNYIKNSIPTIIMVILIIVLQLMPSLVSSIGSTLVVISYFVYIFNVVIKNRINEAIINLFEFSVLLFLFVLMIEVLL